MDNNKRKLVDDSNNLEQSKKICIDKQKIINDRAKLLHNESLAKEGMVIIICDDGEIIKTKAGILLWQRSFFTLYQPLNTKIRFEMPMRNTQLKCSFAFVTMIDALRLRVAMAECAKISGDYSSIHLEHKEKVNENTDPEDWLDHYRYHY